MNTTNLFILSLSLISTFLLCQFGITKQWWAAVKRNRGLFFLFVIWFGITFVGSSSASQISGLGIPDTARLFRVAVLGGLALYALAKISAQVGAFKLAGSCISTMLVYGIFALLSSAWSVAPIISLWKSFEVLVFILVAVSLAPKLRSLESIKTVLNFLNVLLLFMVVSVLWGVAVAPDKAFAQLEYATGPMGFVVQGVFPRTNPNTMTQLAAILVCICSTYYLGFKRVRTGKAILLLIASMSFLTMILAHSRTSLLAFALMMLIIVYFYRNAKLIAITSIAGGAGAIFGLSSIISSYFMRGQSEKTFSSLSGRLNFWEKAWEIYIQSPIIGHGFYSQRVTLGTSTVDMTYLQILLNLGVVGLVIMMAALCLCGIKFLRTWPNKFTSSEMKMVWINLLIFFVFVIVRSLTGPTFQDFHNNLILLLLIFILQAAFTRIWNQQKRMNKLE